MQKKISAAIIVNGLEPIAALPKMPLHATIT
jgi:hypothetical protein